MRRASSIRACGLAALLLPVGCEGDKTGGETAASASATVAAPAPTATSDDPVWTKMPDLQVEDLGVLIGGRRADLKKKEGLARLQELVAKLPIEGKPVTVQADKKARIKDVATLIEELGKKGAPSVLIKTAGRGDLPKEIAVTPLSRISDPAPCSVVVSTLGDFSTGVWSLSGGGGKKHTKGFAGPDISNTEGSVIKALRGCDSKTAFFSASEKHDWELCFNMGALIVKSDPDKKIDKLVLLGDEPVAGRAVKLEGG